MKRSWAWLLLGVSLQVQAAEVRTVRVLISADKDSILSAQMAGKAVAINANLGDRVRSGQPLIRFDCEEQVARLNMAKAELDGAEDLYATKKKLQAMQSASLLEVGQARAQVEKFTAQIQLYQTEIRLCGINAPFSGRVTKLSIKPYESVNAGQPLLELVSDEKLKIQGNIPSAWISRMKHNTPFTVHVDETGSDYPAHIRRINGKVDTVSQTIEIEGEFDKSSADLLPGMSGTAHFPGMEK